MATTNNTCPEPMKATSNGSWQGDNPLNFAVPLVIVQICVVVVLTRTLAFLLKPLRQPRVIAEIIGGILLGPSAAGRSKRFLHAVFPLRSLTVLDTLANLGLIFFLFLVGLELDVRAIRRSSKKALAIAVIGISVPFLLGIGTSVVFRNSISRGVRHAPFLVFIGVALSITAFPVLARILAELKLLTTDLGRIAMAAAAVNDVVAWILLALAIALSSTGATSPLVSLWVLLSAVAFVCFAAFTLRPLLGLMARRSAEGEPVKEVYVCMTLTMVLAAGFTTDIIGIHALFGAFVVGMVMPKEGPFAGAVTEKVEDLMSALFLPLYFVSSGLKTDVATIQGGQSWLLLLLVVATACVGKIGGTVAVSMACKMPIREALALGFLMNTKGLVELIVLNIGKDRQVLNDETFAILVLMALFTTFITTPLMTIVYKPARGKSMLRHTYKHRCIQRNSWDTELRILACFHSNRSIPTLINLIESSRGTRRGGITVYAMHLMEISERSSAISMVHKARRNGLPFWNKKHLVVAFEAYRQLSSVTIRPMTAISDYVSIHEDVCTCARQKRAALIILPFHKHQRIDGAMDSLGPDFHDINRRVLLHAPCSVAILIDRGLGGTTQVPASNVSFSAVVLFFGGPDDREAVAYGSRIAEHPGISLTVMRFVAQPGQTLMWSKGENVAVNVDDGNHEAKKADDNCIADYKGCSSCGPTRSMLFEEREVGSKDEVIAAVKALHRCNIFLVGRRPPTAPLVTRTDCPELGPIGSYLASSEYSTTASVLVIQQYDPSAAEEDSLVSEEMAEVQHSPDSPTPSEL